MAWIWKRYAGADSFGHTWPENGAVVEIDDADQIAQLMRIPDGGFFEVPPPETTKTAAKTTKTTAAKSGAS